MISAISVLLAALSSQAVPLPAFDGADARACGGAAVPEASVLARGPAATLVSDKLDYVPGERVVLRGRGWAPGEAVRVVLRVDPATHEDVGLDLVADAAGAIESAAYLVRPSDLGVIFRVTATGLESGIGAGVLTFTDDGTIFVTIVGDGTVTSTASAKTGQSVDCPLDCVMSAGNGETITFTAAPDEANAIVQWTISGGATCADGPTCDFTPGTGGAKTITVTFANPEPAITRISPAFAYVGDPSFNLTVQGTGFVHASSVSFGVVPVPTNWVSTTELSASISSVLLLLPGRYPVTVTNPLPGGGTSASRNFIVATRADAGVPADAGREDAGPADAASVEPDAGVAQRDAGPGEDAAEPADAGVVVPEDGAVAPPDGSVPPADAAVVADAQVAADGAVAERDGGAFPADVGFEPVAPEYDLGGCGCGAGGPVSLAGLAALALLQARRRRERS